MTITKCDKCGQDYMCEIEISTRGLAGKGGILLPSKFHHRDFCNIDCFFKWIVENYPDKLKEHL